MKTKKDHIILINPANEDFGGFLSRYIPLGLPIALGILAAYLMKFGHKVKVLNDEIEVIDEDNIKPYLNDLPGPYVFGITVLTSQAQRAYDICSMLKKNYPDCFIIMGGIHVTALPEEGLANGADVVVKGEGEVTLKTVYEAFLAKESWHNTTGIAYLDQQGEICITPDGELIRDLDEIPIFPFHLFENPKYDMGVIAAARGCPYKCNYCSQRLLTGLTYRWHSVERVVEMLDILVNKYNQDYVNFYDDNFSVNKRRVKELCEGIVAKGLHKKAMFRIQTRADNLYPEIMPYMRKANFQIIGFGMETASDRLVEVINKEQTTEQHTKSIELGRKWGMDMTVFMIFGLPTETRADRKLSYEYTRKMDLRFTKFNNLIPYPGTKLYNEVKDTPQIHILKNWSNFNSTLAATRSIFDTTPLPYVPEGTTPWQLKRDIVKSNLGWYFRFKPIMDFLFKGTGGDAMLPKGWYLRPREVFEVAKLGLTLLSNYMIALLPDKVGYFLYRMVTGQILEERKNPHTVDTLPDAIDGSMRKFKLTNVPKDSTVSTSSQSAP